MEREKQTKLMMVGGVALFAVAIMILLLFVLPANRLSGTPSEAQPAGGPPGMTGGPGMPPSMPGPPGGMPGMPPAAPGAPGGMPGMQPGMPGAPGGMPGMPGEMPGAMPGWGDQWQTQEYAAAPVDTFKGDPLEAARRNPFGQVGVPEGVLITPVRDYRTAATRYGPDWSQLPITLHTPFIRPWSAPHPPPDPTKEQAEAQRAGVAGVFRVSSILWPRTGRPSATLERATGQTEAVAPGDTVDGWRVTEIGRNYVIVQDPATSMTQRLSLKSAD